MRKNIISNQPQASQSRIKIHFQPYRHVFLHGRSTAVRAYEEVHPLLILSSSSDVRELEE